MENFFHYYNHHQPPSSSSLSSQPLQSQHHLHKERKKVGAGPSPKRGGGGGGGVKLSTDPQSVAARERRHRISDRFRILKSLVPGGSKMDTVSMLEEAIHYVKFLKAQIWLHQAAMLQYSHEDEQQTLSSTSNTMAASLPPPEGLMLYNSMVAPSMPLLPNFDRGTFQGDQDMAIHDGGFNY